MLSSRLARFVEDVWDQGRQHYRSLPWRHIEDPYGVLVSEVMLQQTQVTRVLGRWEAWMRLFPTVDALAAADTATVLEQWQGLGYNRRALALKRACEACARDFGGALPKDEAGLLALPGVGACHVRWRARFCVRGEGGLYRDERAHGVHPRALSRSRVRAR